MARPVPPLPTRNGVGPSCVVLPAGPWGSVGDCVVARFSGVTPSEWARRFGSGEVVDEAGESVSPGRAHRAGLRLYYYRTLDAEPRVPFEETVLFRDDHIVVADKPHFLPVTPSGRHLQQPCWCV